jgi:TPP-dependent pyruvate/acetoin dehydrogenase alpha subunit
MPGLDREKKRKESSTIPEKEISARAPSVLRNDCVRVLSESNKLESKAKSGLSKAELLHMYRAMARVRAFDERGMMLQRQGRIGFYVPSFGQEAIQIGTVAAYTLEDFVFPSYREPGIFLFRGVDPYLLMCNLFGNVEDTSKGRQMPVHYSFPEKKLFSISSPIATQMIQAVGAAMAFKLRREKHIAIGYCGDGGTSENDFHTALTFAGTYKAPVVFVITNNQLAISVPFSKQTGARAIVDKGVGYGIAGVAVDGNDVLAVNMVMAQAVYRARIGEGSTLIECVTFRMGPHSSSDDPSRYRDEKLYQAWKKRDPIERFRSYLCGRQLWDDRKEKELWSDLKEEMAHAAERAEKIPLPDVTSLFEDVYATMSPVLIKQQRGLLEEQRVRGTFENSSEAFPL